MSPLSAPCLAPFSWLPHQSHLHSPLGARGRRASVRATAAEIVSVRWHGGKKKKSNERPEASGGKTPWAVVVACEALPVWRKVLPAIRSHHCSSFFFLNEFTGEANYSQISLLSVVFIFSFLLAQRVQRVFSVFIQQLFLRCWESCKSQHRHNFFFFSVTSQTRKNEDYNCRRILPEIRGRGKHWFNLDFQNWNWNSSFVPSWKEKKRKELYCCCTVAAPVLRHLSKYVCPFCANISICCLI